MKTDNRFASATRSSSGKSSLTFFLLPMKLSSTINTGPRQPTSFQRVKLGEHLLIALRARNASVDLDDVAKLAGERTAARVLHRHATVSLEIYETKIRNRCERHRRAFGRFVNALCFAAFQVFEKLRQRCFSFALKNVIGVGSSSIVLVTYGPPSTISLAKLSWLA